MNKYEVPGIKLISIDIFSFLASRLACFDVFSYPGVLALHLVALKRSFWFYLFQCVTT